MIIVRYVLKFTTGLTIIPLVATLLVVIWFRDGSIMGTGESGLPFYNFQLHFDWIKNAWANYTLGHPTNISVASKPFYFIFLKLQNFGIPSFLLQAGFLWTTLVVSGLGIYYLTRQLFPFIQQKIALLAVLFYWFNPLSLVNVWNRFLNNYFVFYAFLPLGLLLFIKGIRSKRYIFAIYIVLISAIFSYAFTSIAFDLIFWFLVTITTIFFLLQVKGLDKLFILKFFFLLAIVWFLANLWWISQALSYVFSGGFQAVATSSFTSNNNYQTFSTLSKELGQLSFLFRLMHNSFFNNKEIWWVGFYNFPPILFLEFIFSLLIFLPFIKRSKSVLFLGILLIVGLLLAKGNNPPLGEMVDWLFLKFYFLQVFRNPFEKFSFIIILAAAPLFAFGVYILSQKIKIFFIVLFWLMVVWGTPFWTGLLFTAGEPPVNQFNVGYQVKVPSYYQDASSWLNSQDGDFRLLALPFREEGITYKWEKGYSGVELSNQILPKTSISFNTNIPFYDEVSKNLEMIFLTSDDFLKVMNVLNVKYIMLRRDIDWKERGIRDPQIIEKRLKIFEEKGLIKKVKEFGELSFWENLSWGQGDVYPVKYLVEILGQPNPSDILQIDFLSEVLHNGGDKIKDENLIKTIIIHPIYRYSLFNKPSSSDYGFKSEIFSPAIKILPSNPLYRIILLKEQLELSVIKENQKRVIKQVELLGKRLVEAKAESQRGNTVALMVALENYTNQLGKSLPLLSKSYLNSFNYQINLQEAIYKLFSQHLIVLSQLKGSVGEKNQNIILEIENMIKDGLIAIGISPIFGYVDSSNFPIKDRIVYQFFIEEGGEYELLLDSKNWDKHFQFALDDSFSFLVDQQLVSRKSKLDRSGLVSYGLFKFSKGRHEISWNTPEPFNLIDAPREISLIVDHGIFEKEYEIKNFKPFSQYSINFNYLIKKGSGFEVALEQNNDRVRVNREGDLIKYSYSKMIAPDRYDFDKHIYNEGLFSRSSADSAKLIFKVKPWNDCESIFQTNKKKCKDESLRSKYDRITEVIISDLSLNKRMAGAPILRKIIKDKNNQLLPIVSYKKNSNTEYLVNIKGVKNPYVLVLSQLYDPFWKVFTASGERIQVPHFLTNTYSNGWLIKQEGDYDLIIKFVPQDLLEIGEKISIFTVGICIIAAGWYLFRKYAQSS